MRTVYLFIPLISLACSTAYTMDLTLLPFFTQGAVNRFDKSSTPLKKPHVSFQENTESKQKTPKVVDPLALFKAGSEQVYGGENLSFSQTTDWEDGSMLEFVILAVGDGTELAKLAAIYYTRAAPAGTVLRSLRVEHPREVKNGASSILQQLDEYVKELEAEKANFIQKTTDEVVLCKAENKGFAALFPGSEKDEPLMIERAQ